LSYIGIPSEEFAPKEVIKIRGVVNRLQRLVEYQPATQHAAAAEMENRLGKVCSDFKF
jgi:hypothetical protein